MHLPSPAIYTVILGLSLVAARPIEAQEMAGSGSIAGHVTDWKSGKPVKNATVELTALGDARETTPLQEAAPGEIAPSVSSSRYTCVSGPKGEFFFGDLGPGQYWLSARKTGFLESRYGTVSSLQLPSIVDLNPEQHLDVTVRLLPHGVITGRIATPDGEAVDAGTVELVSTLSVHGRVRSAVVQSVTPNDLGDYRIAGLQPGTYYVRFQPRASGNDAGSLGSQASSDANNREMQPVLTYYPSAVSPRDAVPISLRIGEMASGNDIVVRQARTYSVKGRLNSSGLQPEFASVSLVSFDEEPTAIVVGNNTLGPGGSFGFFNVAPGEYALTYVAGTNQGVSVGRTNVSVIDKNVEAPAIEVAPFLTVAGTILVENQADAELAGVKVRLATVDALVGPSYDATVQRDGSFVISGCSPGEYTVTVKAPEGLYLKAVRYGSGDSTNSLINIGAAGPKLEIVLRSGAARLQGTIQATDGGVVQSSAYYAAVLADGKSLEPSVRLGRSDSRGRFELAGLVPGRYRLFAFVTPAPMALQSPKVLEALQPLGAEVELREGEQSTVMTRLIPAAEGARIFGLAR
jgi:hypothetical protein